MLWLYMDVHVKAAITAGVRRRGSDMITAREDGATRLEDVPCSTARLHWGAYCSVRMTVYWPLLGCTRPNQKIVDLSLVSVPNRVYFLILQICTFHFDVRVVALTITLPKNLKKHLTPVSQPLYSCLHLSSSPTGPGLQPTDWGRSLLPFWSRAR